ncbi:serine hydrolase domain-containing protein [Streptomyces sp. NPDC056231]|uniref:serine hydrolase domain-containing protein n=1 Tax=Streptomyces sp. NPDC056231 TaxID=3345755 RepID=UPI003AAABC52
MDSDSVRGINRRRLLGWSGLAAAGVVAAGAPLVGARPGDAVAAGQHRPTSTDPDIPPDTRPGGAYDRYVAKLAAEGKFSGVVLLSHKGRTVLSRSYGMADQEKGIRNHEGIAFSLSSAGKPFGAVAILQLAQQGKLSLSDTVGTHLKGYAKDIAEQVTIHHLLSGTSGLNTPDEDVQRIFQSREEVHEYYEQWARQSKVVAPPGTPTGHSGADIAIPAQIVEAVTGKTYWDYVQEHIFGRCSMTGTAFYTRPQWLTDEHIAHPYMTLADGSQVDAVRNLDKDSPNPAVLGKNPGRSFIDAPGDGGFATAPDLVRFAHALGDGTVLDRPYAELLTGAKIPHSGSSSFGAYDMPVHIVNGQWVFGRGGGNPGVSANWNIYPYTGWVGVVLGNCDGLPLQEITGREMQAITGASPGDGGGG